MEKSAGISVVLADPLAVARDSLRRLIETWGWTVLAEAADGFEAVRHVRATHADVLLIDAAIEGLNVTEVRQLLHDAPVLVVTLLDRPEQHARRLGPSVLKSVPAEAMRHTIETELHRRWTAAPSAADLGNGMAS